MTDTTTAAAAGGQLHAGAPLYPAYAEYRDHADWHVYLPDSPRGPLGYCLTSQGDAPFDPVSATAELAERGWQVVGGADGWTEHGPDAEHQWTATVAPAEASGGGGETEDAGPVAVPAGLVDALRDRLEEDLDGAGVDTGALALELARTAVSWESRYRPGVVL